MLVNGSQQQLAFHKIQYKVLFCFLFKLEIYQ